MFKKAYRFCIAINDFVSALRGLVMLAIFAIVLVLAGGIGYQAWAIYSKYESKIAAVGKAYESAVALVQEKADLSVAAVIKKAEKAAEVYHSAHEALAGQREEIAQHLKEIASQKEQMLKLLAVSRELSESQFAKIQGEIAALGDLKSAAATYAADALKREMLERQLAETKEQLAHVREQYEKVSGYLANQGGAAGEKAREVFQNLKKPFTKKGDER